MARKALRPNRPNIGGAVRRLRLATGLTQADLAQKADIANETLSRIETSRMLGVSMDLCTRLATALGVPVSDLFVDVPEPKRSALRPPERALLALVSGLTDDEVNDVVKLIRLAVKVGRHVRAPAGDGRSPAGRPPSKQRRRA